LRGTYSVNDKVNFVLGVNNGWDDVTNNASLAILAMQSPY